MVAKTTQRRTTRVPVVVRSRTGEDLPAFLLRPGDDDLHFLSPVQALLRHGQFGQTGRPAETGHLGSLVIRLRASHLRDNREFPLGRDCSGTPGVPRGRARNMLFVPGGWWRGEPGRGKRAGGSPLLTTSWQQPVLRRLMSFFRRFAFLVIQ